jgi:hypothetical protein
MWPGIIAPAGVIVGAERMNTLLPQFLSVSLPIMVTLVATIWIASWAQNKRFDDLRSDMNRQFDETNARLERIERKLDSHDERIVRVEEHFAHPPLNRTPTRLSPHLLN